jgi:hypothetical protein
VTAGFGNILPRYSIATERQFSTTGSLHGAVASHRIVGYSGPE